MYDYHEGKKRVVEILDNIPKINDSPKIPGDGGFTFENAHYGWVTAIFVDIRNSTGLFASENKEEVSKIVRSFTSEIIEILRGSDNERSIGIRGDCVFAIYATSTQKEIYDCVERAVYINTFLKMLNKLLDRKGFNNIEAGIGISTSQELVIKAGRIKTGINDKIWIGKAVTGASNLSSLGNKGGMGSIVISPVTCSNLEDVDPQTASIFKAGKNRAYYHGNLVNILFNKWIDEGMSN